VHTPIEGKSEYVKYFQEKLKKSPPPDGPEYEKESAGETKLKQDNAKYAAMIKAVDDGVGKFLKALDEAGLTRNTIIIVTSDHGGLSSRGNNRELATSNKPLRAGKGHLYEGGLRVPLIVKWPGVVKPGSETSSMVIGADHFSTLLEIAGGKVPETQRNDGTSYVHILKGGKPVLDRTLYWHNPAPRPTSTADIYSSAIRTGDYKLVDLYANNRIELYNLKEDIGEAHDISARYPELTRKLYAQLNAWRNVVKADMKVKQKGLPPAEKAEQKIESGKEMPNRQN
jgi:arylsulfatase A-like enzyme